MSKRAPCHWQTSVPCLQSSGPPKCKQALAAARMRSPLRQTWTSRPKKGAIRLPACGMSATLQISCFIGEFLIDAIASIWMHLHRPSSLMQLHLSNKVPPMTKKSPSPEAVKTWGRLMRVSRQLVEKTEDALKAEG